MEHTSCGSHAKKCKSHSADPIWGRQGEWTTYQHFSPLHDDGPSGYNEKCENWEDILVISELAHAQEIKTWADRCVMLDRAYKSKARKLEIEYESAIERGFEEAYETLRNMQKVVQEKEAWIAVLEARLKEYEKVAEQHDQQVS